MESLMDYGDGESADSDSEGEPIRGNFNHKTVVKGLDRNINTGDINNAQQKEESMEHECSDGVCKRKRQYLTQDFFGLCENSGEDPSEPLAKQWKEEEREKHVVDGSAVEIPSSGFWNNISKDDISIERKMPFHRRKSPHINKDLFINNGKGDCTNNSMTKDDVSEVRNRGVLNGEIQYFSTIENSTRVEKPYINNHNDSNSRRIFYVHSKIQPWLNSGSTSNRIPSRMEKQLIGHSGVVNRVTWNNPNYSHLFASASMDNSIKVWNIWSSLDVCVKKLSLHSKAVKDVVWSRCGQKLLTSSYDRTALVIDVETGKIVRSFPHNSYVTCGRYHTVDPNIVLTGALNVLQCWDLRVQGEPHKSFSHKDHLGQVQDILFNPDGGTFFSSGDLVSRDSADRNIIAWDFSTGIILSNQIYQERYACTRLKLNTRHQAFLAQTHGSYIAVFSLSKPYKMDRSRRFEGHKNLGYSIGFDVTPDSRTVMSGSSDGNVYCYDYQTGKITRKINTGLDLCMDVDCHPVLNSTMVCCGWNGSIQVWS